MTEVADPSGWQGRDGSRQVEAGENGGGRVGMGTGREGVQAEEEGPAKARRPERA